MMAKIGHNLEIDSTNLLGETSMGLAKFEGIFGEDGTIRDFSITYLNERGKKLTNDLFRSGMLYSELAESFASCPAFVQLKQVALTQVPASFSWHPLGLNDRMLDVIATSIEGGAWMTFAEKKSAPPSFPKQ